MSRFNHHKRVLALDVRPRSFGYAVFEGLNRILDWGVRSYRKADGSVPAIVRKNVEQLIGDFAPGVLVIKDRWTQRGKTSPKLKKILAVVEQTAKKHRVPLRAISRKAVKKAFAGQGRVTKHSIATALASRYLELSWKLPPKRKPWQSEDYRMSIFDAAALGFAYFEREAHPSGIASAGTSPPSPLA